LFGVLAVMGALVVVMVPPTRWTPPAARSAALTVTAVSVSVVAVELFVAMPPPLRVAVLPVMTSGLPDTPVVVNVPRRPL
jgi:hypothetical protein